MRNITHKILSLSLCLVYILASCGIVRHVCDTSGVEYLSLLANDNCSLCLEHQTNDEHQQCCNHHSAESETKDEDCCEKTVQTLSSDQNYSPSSSISSTIFFTLNSILFPSETHLVCDISSKTLTAKPPLLSDKTPLIYHTGQLRL